MSVKPLWHQHPHVRSGKQLLLRERAADLLKRVFGTWSILGIVALIIAVWIVTGGLGTDPMPFILLNLCLSCLAAVQGIILQIAANRGDRQASELAVSTHAHGEQVLALNQQQLVILNQQTEMLNELRELRALITAPPTELRQAPAQLTDEQASQLKVEWLRLHGGGHS
jgi:uncharacterized membrane protein